MKPPPLLLLLLVAGFVSCIPRERYKGEDAKDSWEPLSAVGESNSPALALSDTKPQIEDANQQLNSDEDANNNFQLRKYLKESNPIQTQEEKEVQLSDMLSRNLRAFRYKQIPSRYRTARRPGYQPRYGVRGRSRQRPEEEDAEDYNDFQQDDEEGEEEDNEEEEEENNEEYEGENYEDDDDDGNDVADYDEEEEGEEEEEEEDSQSFRRAPPKHQRGKLRRGRGRTGRRGRYRRDLEVHEEAKRGFRDKLRELISRKKKNNKKETSNSDTGEKYSDFDDDDDETRPLLNSSDEDSDSDGDATTDYDETTPLLRSSRKKLEKNLRNRRLYPASRDFAKRGLFSNIKNIFKKKKRNRPPYKPQKYDSDESSEEQGYGYNGYGRDGGYGAYDEMNSNRFDNNEEMYDDSRYYRGKRGDLNLLERALRTFAIMSSHLKDNITESTKTPSPDTLDEGLGEGQVKEDEDGEYEGEDEDEVKDEGLDEDQIKEDEGGEYEDDDENEVKDGRYEEEEENKAQNEKNERLDDEYFANDNETIYYEDRDEGQALDGEDKIEIGNEKNGRIDEEYDAEDNESGLGDEYEVLGEETGSGMDEYETENEEYEAQDNESGQVDEYEALGEENGSRMDDYETENEGYKTQDQEIQTHWI